MKIPHGSLARKSSAHSSSVPRMPVFSLSLLSFPPRFLPGSRMSFDENTIAENAEGPAEAEDDAGRVKQHSLPDQIAADAYIAKKTAAASRSLPIRIGRIRPPGAV